jgi:anti-sigma B factor antagonist
MASTGRWARQGRWIIDEIWGYATSRLDGVCTVALSGELDMSNSDAVVRVMTDELNRPGTRALRVDLADVTFLGSSGISALVTVGLAAEDLGLGFAVVRPHPNVRVVLELVGLLEFLSVDASSAHSAPADRRADSPRMPSAG